MDSLLMKVLVISTLSFLPITLTTAPPWSPSSSQNCKPVPPDCKPPDFEESILDDILSAGTLHLNWQTRKACTLLSESTFIFGNVGFGKTILTQLIVGDYQKLEIGVTKGNDLVILRDVDNRNQITEFQKVKTLLPDYYEYSDSFGEAAFWDCPGFGYNQGLKADVAELYFLKHALEATASAKFIFTISFPNIIFEEELRKLATHAATLIRNITKFKDSIGLVVTEVNVGSEHDDQEILSYIRDTLKSFIKSEKTSIERNREDGQKNSNIEQLWQRILFFEGLLEEIGDREGNCRVYFLRNPEACGYLPEMSAVLDTVEKLKFLQFSVLVYSTILRENFGFTLRSETRSEIEHLLRTEEYKEAETYVTEVALEIIQKIDKSLREIEKDNQKLEVLLGFQELFQRNFGRFVDTDRTLEPCRVTPRILVVSEMDLLMTCSSQKLKTFNFLQDAMRESKNRAPPLPAWAVPFQVVESGLNNLTLFYEFCDNTYNALGMYSNQLVLKDLKNKDGVIIVNNDTVLDLLARAQLEVPNEIKTMWETYGYTEQQHLVELVENQMPVLPNFTCEHESSTTDQCKRGDFVGRNVFLSEVLQYYKSNFVRQCCSSSVGFDRREISIVAGEKLYIDIDFYSSETYYLYYMSIVAPIWEVREPLPGEYKVTLKFNGWWPNMHGGGFFGVYSAVINSQKLVIETTGDRGFVVDDSDIVPGGDSGTVFLLSTSKKANLTTAVVPGPGGNHQDDREIPGKITEIIYMPGNGIIDYNNVFGDQILSTCNPTDSLDFFWGMRFSVELAYVYTPLYFANELDHLEQYYITWKESNINSKCAVQSLSTYYERILAPITARLAGANETDKLAFTLIGSLVIGRLISQRRLEKSMNVISTEVYLEALDEDLKIVEKLEISVAIARETEKFKGDLDKKVKEAEKLISGTVQPAIKKAEKELGEMNKKLIDTIEVFLKKAEDHQTAVKNMKDQFYSMAPFKAIMGSFSIVATVASACGPKGEAIAGAINTGLNFGGLFLDGPRPETAVTPVSSHLFNDTDEYYEDLFVPKSNSLARISEEDKRKAKIVKRTSISNAPEWAQSMVSILKKYHPLEAEIKQMEEAIEAAKPRVEAMEKMKDNFHSQFVPALDDIGKKINEETSNLTATSQAGLTVKKFDLKNHLKRMSKLISGFVGPISENQNRSRDAGTEVHGEPKLYENFFGAIEGLEQAFTLLIDMYTHIENYQDRKKLAQFIANVNSPSTGIDRLFEDNPLLKAALKKAELSIRTNLILEEYNKAERAFKQFVFPFARDHLKKNNEIFKLNLNGSIAEVFEDCRKQISNFRSIVQKYSAITTVDDDFVFYANFTSGPKNTRPFFVWKNEKWNNTILDLFQGNATRLKAECNMSGFENENFFVNKTAIKFKNINIYVRAHDNSRQNELNAVLEGFQLSMTHSGMSLYIVHGQQFVMRDMPQTFRYNFESHTAQNMVRYKVTSPSTDLLLSPYTWWTLKLKDLAGNGFEGLEKFASEVDLELEGSGTYLDEGEAGTEYLNDLQLTDYYESVEPEPNVTETAGGNETNPDPEPDLRYCSQVNYGLSSKSDEKIENVPFSWSQGLFQRESKMLTKNSNQDDGLDYYSKAPKTEASRWLEKRPDSTQNDNSSPEEEEPQAEPGEKKAYFDPEPRQARQYYEEEEEPQADAGDKMSYFDPEPRQVREYYEEEETEKGNVEDQQDGEKEARQYQYSN